MGQEAEKVEEPRKRGSQGPQHRGELEGPSPAHPTTTRGAARRLRSRDRGGPSGGPAGGRGGPGPPAPYFRSGCRTWSGRARAVSSRPSAVAASSLA